MVDGPAEAMLENATSDGKILNALDLPLWNDPQWDRRVYATDMVAWDFVRGKPYNPINPYPIEHMRWGLAGTAHSRTDLHIDSDGFATFIKVICGKKVWAVYRPSSNLPLSNTNVFVDHTKFKLDEVPETSEYGLEAIVLKPGDELHVFVFISIHYALTFVQIFAAWPASLCLWHRAHYNSRWTLLLCISNASNSKKPGTHICSRQFHFQHFPLPFP